METKRTLLLIIQGKEECLRLLKGPKFYDAMAQYQIIIIIINDQIYICIENMLNIMQIYKAKIAKYALIL